MHCCCVQHTVLLAAASAHTGHTCIYMQVAHLRCAASCRRAWMRLLSSALRCCRSASRCCAAARVAAFAARRASAAACLCSSILACGGERERHTAVGAHRRWPGSGSTGHAIMQHNSVHKQPLLTAEHVACCAHTTCTHLRLLLSALLVCQLCQSRCFCLLPPLCCLTHAGSCAMLLGLNGCKCLRPARAACKNR
jgi:hypothetical protein